MSNPCEDPKVKKPTVDEIKAGVPEILKLLGDKVSTSCTTAYVEANVSVPFAEANASAGASNGCEAIAIMAQSYSSLTKISKCSISRLTNTSSTDVTVVNNITVKLVRSVLHGDFKLLQNIRGKVLSSSFVSEQVTTEMTNNISSTIQQMMTNLQKVEQSGGQVAPGGISVQDIQTEINNEINDSTIAETVNEFINTIRISNNATIELTDVIVDGDFFSGQDIIFDVAISNMVSKVFSSITSNSVVTDYIAQQVSEQSSKTLPLGSSSSLKFIGILIFIGIIVGFQYMLCKNMLFFLCAMAILTILLIMSIIGLNSDDSKLFGLISLKYAYIVSTIIVVLLIGKTVYTKVITCPKMLKSLPNININELKDNVKNGINRM